MVPELKAPILIIPFYRTRWFKRLLIVVGAMLLIVVIVAIALFAAWLNSPEKALLDAADYSVTMPGSYTIKSQDTNLNVTLRDEEYSATGTIDGIPLQAVLYGETLNVKSPRPDELYNLLMGTPKDQPLPTIMQTIIPTVKNTWIAIDLSNVTLKSQSALTMQCVFQEKESISHDPNARRQWGSVYLANRFLDIKTVKQSSATTYDVSINRPKRNDFFTALQKTSFYQSLTNCSRNTDVFRNLGSDAPLADVVLSPQHTFQSAVIDPHGKDPMTITAKYTDVPTINVPTNATSTDQLVIRYLQSVGGAIPD